MSNVGHDTAEARCLQPNSGEGASRDGGIEVQPKEPEMRRKIRGQVIRAAGLIEEICFQNVSGSGIPKGEMNPVTHGRLMRPPPHAGARTNLEGRGISGHDGSSTACAGRSGRRGRDRIGGRRAGAS